MVRLDLSSLEQTVSQAMVNGPHSQSFAAAYALLEKELSQTQPEDVSKLRQLLERMDSVRRETAVPLCVAFYSQADDGWFARWRSFISILQRQGMLRVWSPADVLPGADLSATVGQMLRQADVIIVLLSADFLASDWERWKELILRQEERGARLVPVLLRAVTLPDELNQRQVLPRDGKPLRSNADQDQAMADLTDEVRRLIASLPRPLPAVPLAVIEAIREATPPRGASRPKIVRIFRSEGLPDLNFVAPKQLDQLRFELDALGRCLIVEGPSKVGKSTAVMHILREQGFLTAQGEPRHGRLILLDGKLARDPASRDEFYRAIVKELEAIRRVNQPRHLIIDDFHYVDDPQVRYQIASRSKALAEQPEPKGKITLIGINPLGRSLVEQLPDLSGRKRLVKMDRHPNEKIVELIVRGEDVANVRFRYRDEFVREADGSFFIAQLFCQEAARLAGISEAQVESKEINVAPSDVLDVMLDDLRARYRDALRNFAAYDQQPPPRGAGLALLWLLSRASDWHIDLAEAIQRFPILADAIGWMAGHLPALFERSLDLTGLLYFNQAAGVLTLEDPQLKFYLRKLNWAELADASGNRGVRWSQDNEPILPSEGRGPTTAPASSESQAPSARAQVDMGDRPRHVLHLSDLHFITSTEDQATRLYAPLAQDLRAQGVDRLDALVLSGDIGTVSERAEYDAARRFIFQLLEGFGLDPAQVVLVPGNHDLNWELSQDAYAPQRRSRVRQTPQRGTYFENGDYYEIRDENRYRERFRYFAEFYRQVRGEEYPLDPAEQFTIQVVAGMLFLGLNSAYEIDHHFKDRAGIQPEAMAKAMMALDRQPPARVRIAVFHHTLGGPGEDRIKEDGFLQQLAVARFRLALHGHIHHADNHLYRHDMGAAGRHIDLIGAGTFGAPVGQWSPGVPLQYNLLRFGADAVTVETRCRESPTGAWRPDARWVESAGRDPAPRYRLPMGPA